VSARSLAQVVGHSRIDGVVPGVRGQRALPTHELRPVDPFVMLDHIGPETVGSDFHVDGHPHPHRGFETLTMLFEGRMDHVDSLGNQVALVSGSTQNMVAGRGIQHGGDMAADPATGRFHEVQLWVNMPAARKMIEPSIDNMHGAATPVVDRGHYRLRVLTGSMSGASSSLATTQPTAVGRLETSGPGPVVVTGIESHWNAIVYVLEGSVNIEGSRVDQFQTAVFANDGDSIELDSNGGADVLILAGLPIGEPVAMGGPFVMNTQAEIAQAERDFAAGLFGEVPAVR